MSPGVVVLNAGEPGTIQTAQITVVNWSDKPIRILGATSDCSCVVTGDLPITLAAGERTELEVRVALVNSPGLFQRRAGLIIDDSTLRTVLFQIRGRILPLPESDDESP